MWETIRNLMTHNIQSLVDVDTEPKDAGKRNSQSLGARAKNVGSTLADIYKPSNVLSNAKVFSDALKTRSPAASALGHVLMGPAAGAAKVGQLFEARPHNAPGYGAQTQTQTQTQPQTSVGGSQPQIPSGTGAGTLNTGGGVTGTGAGGYVTPEPDPWYYSADELAGKFGINMDFDSYKKELENIAREQLRQTGTNLNRMQNRVASETARNYETYLQDMSRVKQGAAASGATRGMRAAEAVAAMLSQGQQQSQIAQTGFENMQDLQQREAEAIAMASTTARDSELNLRQFLANMGSQYEANDVNRLSAQLMAQSQIEAERIKASGTTRAQQIASSAANPINQMLQAGLTPAEIQDMIRRQYSS